MNNAKALASQDFQGCFALFKCKVLAVKPLKTLHISHEPCDARVKIRIVYMSESCKNG